MDPAQIPYFNDREDFMARMENENQLIFNSQSDYSTSECCDYESSLEGDYYLEDDFTTFKDVTRSRKFYLKKELDEPRLVELKDVFMERIAEDVDDSEEEKIIQVVWSEEDQGQNKLVRFVEASDLKKSNSKFTFSMLDDDRGAIEIDSSEGEEIRGRFLEVKDSLEVIATSSRSLHGSDWDFSTEEEQGVNKIWRKRASPWTSSLQIEIGKLPSEADQETVLQVLEDGAQGKINVRDVTECLGNLLERVNQDYDDPQTKKVSFCAESLNKCNLSQGSSQSQKITSQKKVSFPVECNNKGILYGAVDKPVKKVSFYELVLDEASLHSDYSKIKKAVSFHDSVEFDKSEKNKDSTSNDESISEEMPDSESLNSTNKSSCDKDQELSSQEVTSNTSIGEKILGSDITSGFSLAESVSTFSIHTISNEGSLADESESHDFSDFSMQSLNQGEEKNLTINFMTIPNIQTNTFSDIESNDLDSGVSSNCIKDTGVERDPLNKLLMNVKHDLKRAETKAEKIGFIRSLIEESLSRKFDDDDVFKPASNCSEDDEQELIGGFGTTLRLIYNQCRDIVDINTLSKSMGLAMTFQETPFNYINLHPDEPNCRDATPSFESSSRVDKSINKKHDGTSEKSKGTNKNNYITDFPFKSLIDDDYLSADSENEFQISHVTMSDPSVSFLLNKYIFLDYPPLYEPYIIGSEQESDKSK